MFTIFLLENGAGSPESIRVLEKSETDPLA
jgi:hypothetical protein